MSRLNHVNPSSPYVCPSCRKVKVSKRDTWCTNCTIHGGAVPDDRPEIEPIPIARPEKPNRFDYGSEGAYSEACRQYNIELSNYYLNKE